ncbi:MAG TPA: pyrimidine dimer DNA glycosylase/endonuclease V, partial [Dehalococcoidia bacterium]|nr:pyrimidine dimer DNA glycosylase/endonuclease V [Dehalococcoidia bacterium]
MRTPLPYPDLVVSARCLDDRRLGKQRVEAMQVLNALRNPANRWRRHPT